MNKHYWVFTFTYVNNKWGGTKYEFLTNKGKKLAYRIAENNMMWDAAENLKLVSILYIFQLFKYVTKI